ncbi:MAG: hypothetical protein J7K81_05775 [Methanophagales archaeon]|nr:hypothetical protein [Methanophagales archaeon]
MKRGGGEKEKMKRERRKFWKALLFMVLFATLAFVSVGCSSISVVYVPNNYSTIQSAVNATNPGDTAKNLNLSLETSKPTSENPANAGPFNDPRQIFVVASLEVIDCMSPTVMLQLINALYSSHSPFTVLVGEEKADILSVNATLIWEMWFPTGIRGNMTINTPKQESTGYYDLIVIENVFGTNISEFVVDAVYYEEAIFDTGSGTYPSIMGIHTGTIIPSHDVNVSKMYTYPCMGTGGHSEYVKFWNESWNITANWRSYQGDWHNISFNNSFTLREGEPYNYTIRTGSYPQIIHEKEFNATGGTITCIEFVDANGKVYNDWTPAIRLE